MTQRLYFFIAVQITLLKRAGQLVQSKQQQRNTPKMSSNELEIQCHKVNLNSDNQIYMSNFHHQKGDFFRTVIT